MYFNNPYQRRKILPGMVSDHTESKKGLQTGHPSDPEAHRHLGKETHRTAVAPITDRKTSSRDDSSTPSNSGSESK